MLFLGNASGHDFQFHLASWMDVAGQWREGIAYPRWAEWANWGFGEPRFVFYPPASWMIGAALGSALPWRMVPGTFIWLALVAAGMSMWRLARDWITGPQAVVAAVLFAVNPYHLVIAYYRSDFAELLAGALLPLLIWAGLGVAREGWRRVPLLAVVFAGIWLSNAPAAVIATYSLGLMLLIACAVRRSFRPLVPGAVAMAAGFGLAAFYILPAAWEQRWVQISQVVGENLRPAENFLFTRANDPEFVLFNWKVSWVAVGVMLVTGIAAVFAARKRRDLRELWWILAALGAVSIALMFSPSMFLWRGLPELKFVQFPWRWLGVLDMVLAFFVAAAMSRSRKIASWLATLIVFAAIIAAGRTMIADAWWDSTDVPDMASAIRSGGGYEGANEYAPVGCDRWELPGDPDDDARPADVSPVPAPPIGKIDPVSDTLVPAAGVRLHVARWTAERKVFTAETAAPVTLALRLVSYPGWEVQMDGQNTRAELRVDTSQMLLPLAPGAHRVDVRFRRTWDRTAGAAISALSAIALLAFVAALRRRRSGEAAR
ncbi:MAG TPA: 6-pyruvoyl-tetrahydropterin synthase-related protein [Candidatus Acidoferrales bacterium]|nr:6-pyruvoyl-tetrahydropterin synthase-related protein [Candidatus Acidoferrales bacterium]